MNNRTSLLAHRFLLTIAIVAATALGIAGCGVPMSTSYPAPESADGAGKDSTLPEPGQVTAAEWSDLDHWAYWGDLLGRSTLRANIDLWRMNLARRVVVHVRNNGLGVCDAVVTWSVGGGTQWTARTDNHGAAYIFPDLDAAASGQISITAERQGERAVAVVAADSATTDVDLDISVTGRSTKVDVMFTVDATGSMGDEMRFLQSELRDVIERAQKMNSEDLRFRLSCNVYRDEGDDYVVRPFPFTSDVAQAVRQLTDQEAGGGGDTPEAVEKGLDDAINAHDWSGDARARLLFLVLDAPPHTTQDRIDKIRRLVHDAQRRGIRIIPIGASGVDRDTEFLLRHLAIATGGTYVFITNDSGIGNSHLEPIVGPYNVEKLNNLLVRLIGRYVQ